MTAFERVRADALASRRRSQAVDLVVDCIKAITEEGGRKALNELAKAGVRMVSTEEVIAAARS